MEEIFDIQRYICWCKLRNLKPKEFGNNETYLKEELGERNYKSLMKGLRTKMISYLCEVA